MKKFFALILSVALLTGLIACVAEDNSSPGQTCFYYPKARYTYGAKEMVLVPEQRDITGHESDLKYLLALYLVGPLDENLVSPFPAQVRLLSVQESDNRLLVRLTDSGKAINDAEFTLASGCMAKTCFDLMDVESVTIRSGARAVTLGPNDLLLFDDVIPEESILEESE